MNEFLKKLMNLMVESKEVQAAISVDEIEAFLNSIKGKKIEHLTISGKQIELIETKNVDGSLRLIAIASTDSVDRGDDVVVPGGIKTTNIKNNMIPMLLQHEHDYVLGAWDKWYVQDNKFIVEGTFLPPVTEWQKDAYDKVKARVLNGISIGFIIDKVSFDKDIRILEEIELLEISVCTVPMNQDCFITEVSEVKSIKKSDSSETVITEVVPPTTELSNSSPEPVVENPVTNEEPAVDNELAKLKEENEALKLKVSELETEITDYESVMEELTAETEQLLKSKGVLSEK